MYDAVIIGGGHNGLACAEPLALRHIRIIFHSLFWRMYATVVCVLISQGAAQANNRSQNLPPIHIGHKATKRVHPVLAPRH